METIKKIVAVFCDLLFNDARIERIKPKNADYLFHELKSQYITANIIFILGFFITMSFAFLLNFNFFVYFITYSFLGLVLLASLLLRIFWGGGSDFIYRIYARLLPVISLGILFCLLYFREQNEPLVGIWILTLPLIAIFVLGKYQGTVISVIVWLWILLVAFLPECRESPTYSMATTMRYFLSYLVIVILAYSYEHTRSRNNRQILKMCQDLARINDELKAIGFLDPLTEVNNKRGFDTNADQLWRLAIREDKPVSFISIDLDNFKNINDAYGQETGDAVLKGIAVILKKCAHRPLDTVVRLGGEEFGVLLFDTPKEQAAYIAEKMRSLIYKQYSSDFPIKMTESVSVSMGVSTQTPNLDSQLDDLIAVAEKNLSKAKENGKNQVCSD